MKLLIRFPGIQSDEVKTMEKKIILVMLSGLLLLGGCSYHKMEDQFRQEGQEFLEKGIQGTDSSEEAGMMWYKKS